MVADEVRSLAQRTQDATVDIQQLVETLQSEAKNAVTSMQKGTSTAQLCLEKVLNQPTHSSWRLSPLTKSLD